MSRQLTVVVNGKAQTVSEGTTVAALVTGRLQRCDGVAVAVNQEVVSRGRWAATALADGDRVELLTAAQGG